MSEHKQHYNFWYIKNGSLPSCILPCLVQLLGSTVVEHDLVFEPDDA